MNENERIKESIKNLPIDEKIRHIWFYYKWFILFGVLVLGFAIVCLSQCASKNDPDAVIMYAGPQSISSAYYKYIGSAFTQIMTEDANSDGVKTVDLVEITLATQKPQNSTDAAIQIMQQQDTNRERFYIERTTGPSVIYLIDKKIYPSMKPELVPLEDIFGYLPNVAFDECGIELKNLECFSKTDMRYLPSDSIICVRKMRQLSMIKGNDSEEYYKGNLQFFKDIVEWKENKQNSIK